MNEFLKIYYSTDEGGGEIIKDEPVPYKAFKDEAEYNNTIKSERSKAQHSLLQELGIEKLSEAKERLNEANSLKEKLTAVEADYAKTQEALVLNEAGIREEFREEALTLAKAKVTEDVSLSKAISLVIEKLPYLAATADKKPNPPIGASKSEKNETEDTLSDHIAQKYPWIKIK